MKSVIALALIIGGVIATSPNNKGLVVMGSMVIIYAALFVGVAGKKS